MFADEFRRDGLAPLEPFDALDEGARRRSSAQVKQRARESMVVLVSQADCGSTAMCPLSFRRPAPRAPTGVARARRPLRALVSTSHAQPAAPAVPRPEPSLAAQRGSAQTTAAATPGGTRRGARRGPPPTHADPDATAPAMCRGSATVPAVPRWCTMPGLRAVPTDCRRCSLPPAFCFSPNARRRSLDPTQTPRRRSRALAARVA